MFQCENCGEVILGNPIYNKINVTSKTSGELVTKAGCHKCGSTRISKIEEKSNERKKL